jgi:uncharacterized protein (DUF302 family)
MRTRSAFGLHETTARLRAAITTHGMAVLAEVDHAAGATRAGLPMRPMVVLAFGNAKAGTPLMQAVPTIGIDLPLRALLWMDQDAVVWLAVNDPATIAGRHGALAGHEAIVATMQRALDAVVAAATTG